MSTNEFTPKSRVLRSRSKSIGLDILTESGESIANRLQGLEIRNKSRSKSVPRIITDPITESLTSILKRRSSSSIPSAWILRKISKYRLSKQKKKKAVRVDSRKNKVLSISPLSGKKAGLVRMPDYYVKVTLESLISRLY